MVQRLVNFQRHENTSSFFYSRNKSGGLIIHIQGASGVGKSHMIEFISSRCRQPLLELGLEDFSDGQEMDPSSLRRWFSIGKRLKAIMLVDKCDKLIDQGASPYNVSIKAFVRTLGLFEGTVFLTSHNTRSINPTFHSLISLTISLPDFEVKTGDSVLSNLAKLLDPEKIRLHHDATKFFSSLEEMPVGWNGHTIIRCFKIAMALAGDGKRSKESVIVVTDDHFKEAMNIMYRSRQSTGDIINSRFPGSYAAGIDDPPPPPPPPRIPVPRYIPPRRRSPPIFEQVHKARGPLRAPTPEAKEQRPNYTRADDLLCIPSLNRVEWDAFKSIGERELFRKTKFCAIDVLKGEPIIKLHDNSNRRRHRQGFAQHTILSESLISHNATRDIRTSKRREPGEAVLPERIRINSPTLLRVFEDILREKYQGSLILFRPFWSLNYFEQELRERTSQLESILRGNLLYLTPYCLSAEC
ncbi:hypothetical protein F4777DRAFT_376723 [Nemania sp. FL0916]|nr:hypothetical protein F4777DRAFT_376723 [Nemania sp. FL0916]